MLVRPPTLSQPHPFNQYTYHLIPLRVSYLLSPSRVDTLIRLRVPHLPTHLHSRQAFAFNTSCRTPLPVFPRTQFETTLTTSPSTSRSLLFSSTYPRGPELLPKPPRCQLTPPNSSDVGPGYPRLPPPPVFRWPRTRLHHHQRIWWSRNSHSSSWARMRSVLNDQ